jgi:hypothetical protein
MTETDSKKTFLQWTREQGPEGPTPAEANRVTGKRQRKSLARLESMLQELIHLKQIMERSTFDV